MITLFEVMKITTEPSKGGCVVSTHEFVMGYTPLQRTRKGNKIGSSRGTALHSAGPLGKGQMRHGVVTTTPHQTWCGEADSAREGTILTNCFF